jgi:hypothetical protein
MFVDEDKKRKINNKSDLGLKKWNWIYDMKI